MLESSWTWTKVFKSEASVPGPLKYCFKSEKQATTWGEVSSKNTKQKKAFNFIKPSFFLHCLLLTKKSSSFPASQLSGLPLQGTQLLTKGAFQGPVIQGKRTKRSGIAVPSSLCGSEFINEVDGCFEGLHLNTSQKVHSYPWHILGAIQTQQNNYSSSVEKSYAFFPFSAPRRQYIPHDTFLITNVSAAEDDCCLLFNQWEMHCNDKSFLWRSFTGGSPSWGPQAATQDAPPPVQCFRLFKSGSKGVSSLQP